MLDFGRRVYEKVLKGDYVLHDKIGEGTSEDDAEKAASYRAVEDGHHVFPFRAKQISDACIKCRTCVRHCPVDAIDIENKTFDLDKCIGCWACINRCPKHAISPIGPEVPELVKKFSGAVKVPFVAEIVM
ncbi:MAG: 4Fe-4S binding protein [Synergistaceae bacterium]|nr:4Fe-4S binding protein [Synergistaceae bacterium]